MRITDILGRQVATIPAKNYPAGVAEITWQPAASVAAGPVHCLAVLAAKRWCSRCTWSVSSQLAYPAVDAITG
ncbi:MAG: hypothetical protein WKG07_05060 [Hymenobacter sp.]